MRDEGGSRDDDTYRPGSHATLEQATLQLPCDRPTVVFVKIPEAWVRFPGTEAAASEALQQASQLSHAPGLVVFHWEEWYEGERGGMVRMVKYRPVAIPTSGHFLPEFREFINPAGRWRYLLDIVREARTE